MLMAVKNFSEEISFQNDDNINFFSFLLRRNTCKLYYSMDKISNITKEFMSGGTDSIQTTIGKESLALLAKAWATELLCLPT